MSLRDIQFANSIRALLGESALAADNPPPEQAKPLSAETADLDAVYTVGLETDTDTDTELGVAAGDSSIELSSAGLASQLALSPLS